MSRRLWRCRNPGCPVLHREALGRLTSDGGLVLAPAVAAFRCYLDSGRAQVVCPACATERDFHGAALFASPRRTCHGRPSRAGDGCTACESCASARAE